MSHPCDQHTPCPDGYMAWHYWARKMSRTHRQVTCEGCGLWKIWLPKDEARRVERERLDAAKRKSDQIMAEVAAERAKKRRRR